MSTVATHSSQPLYLRRRIGTVNDAHAGQRFAY